MVRTTLGQKSVSYYFPSICLIQSDTLHFASAFYRAIGYGRDIKTAFDLGNSQIDLADLGEQNIPKLLALRLDPKDLYFVNIH
jgi:hypothetical protein